VGSDAQAQPMSLVDHRLINLRLHYGRGIKQRVDPDFNQISMPVCHLPDLRPGFIRRFRTIDLVLADGQQSGWRRARRSADAAVGTEDVSARGSAFMLVSTQLVEQGRVQTESCNGCHPIGLILFQLTQNILPVVIFRFNTGTVHDADMRVIRNQAGNDGLAATINYERFCRVFDGARTDRANFISLDNEG
jgi:hypothetical protein